jgi:hypothetical protein
LGMQPQMGGKFHLKLNMGTRPIANKYREGKMKRTLKRELKVREIVERETLETSNEIFRSPNYTLRLTWGTLIVFRSASVWLTGKRRRECS